MRFWYLRKCSLWDLLGTRTPDTSCLPCYPCPANITSLLIYQGLFGERGWLMAVPVLLMAFISLWCYLGGKINLSRIQESGVIFVLLTFLWPVLMFCWWQLSKLLYNIMTQNITWLLRSRFLSKKDVKVISLFLCSLLSLCLLIKYFE